MIDPINLLIVIFLTLAVVVGVLATAKNRSFIGWFLLSFLITPVFALLVLMSVPIHLPRYDDNALVGGGERHASTTSSPFLETDSFTAFEAPNPPRWP